MSIFEHRKPAQGEHASRDALTTLRETLMRLEAEFDDTPRITDLKRILAARIAEMERKSA
jgi:hypothetical protein